MGQDGNNGLSGVSRSLKDGRASGGFLTKASSSLKRSPSKKHKYQSSQPLPNLETALLQHPDGMRSVSERTAPRPGFQRVLTAPLDIQAVRLVNNAKEGEKAHSAVEGTAMVVTPVGNTVRTEHLTHTKSAGALRPTLNSYVHHTSYNLSGDGYNPAIAAQQPSTAGTSSPAALLHHIQEMANKRISTLDYLRKAHEGRVYWFNTVHFSRTDLSKLPAFAQARVARKATNYFLLGLSIPTIVDMHPVPSSQQASTSSHAVICHEFLRALSTLLSEFDTYQSLHPIDGSSHSSISRARIPQMFKRATHTSSRGRRSSNAGISEIGMPLQPTTSNPSQPSDNASIYSVAMSSDTSSIMANSSTSTLVAPAPTVTVPLVSFPSASTFPTSTPHDPHSNSSLLPNEGPYSYLLSPPIPFAPDFYAVFATLCDVLIDAYQRILALVNSAAVCTPMVGEMFTKADSRLRKIIVGGIVKDFESAAREGAKRDVQGVQRVVLGGLMGG